ncbi:hypothetical protein CYY_004822 [Polysphondylium violaceum]|uniref:Pseudouridine synthase n=1 Tax=Polysphondylium violaceum TaxID=133409 RepID=A0A8J4V4S6_9MYCE|nr:hypothetical protein CYY_004822 [Polysphondylium violaceum]
MNEEKNENNKRTLEDIDNVDENDNKYSKSNNTTDTTDTATTIDTEKINKKYIQPDGTILSKEEYKKNIKEQHKKRKIENRRNKKNNKKVENYKKNEEEGNITKELLAETTCFVENGLRFVNPYQYTFKVNAKERWFGRSLLEMFSTEFSTLPQHIYHQKIKRGLITINGQQSSPNSIIKLNDVISHNVHRHEPPVTDKPIKIVALNDDIVVVDKPASIPVHPCGRFRHNSLTFMLASQHGLTHLYGVHRLDRLTSGLLILARTPAAAKAKSTQIQKGTVQKTYLAKVKGKFPSNDNGDFIVVDQPLVIQNMRLGINYVGPQGKPSVTHFKLYSYNAKEDTSIVLCLPKTGRTHQIRIHLQWLKFPILNDPLYNDEFKKNVSNSKSFTSDGISDLYGEGDDDNNNNDITPSTTTLNEPKVFEDIQDDESIPIECKDCSIVWSDPTQFSFGIYLHAKKYESQEWSFETELPFWAIDDNNVLATTTTTISDISTSENKKEE